MLCRPTGLPDVAHRLKAIMLPCYRKSSTSLMSYSIDYYSSWHAKPRQVSKRLTNAAQFETPKHALQAELVLCLRVGVSYNRVSYCCCTGAHLGGGCARGLGRATVNLDLSRLVGLRHHLPFVFIIAQEIYRAKLCILKHREHHLTSASSKTPRCLL